MADLWSRDPIMHITCVRVSVSVSPSMAVCVCSDFLGTSSQAFASLKDRRKVQLYHYSLKVLSHHTLLYFLLPGRLSYHFFQSSLDQ